MQMAMAIDPALTADLRVITRIGPYSMSSFVVSSSCSSTLAQAIQYTLVNMHLTEVGATLLSKWQVKNFSPVEDSTYDDIRRMVAQNKHITL